MERYEYEYALLLMLVQNHNFEYLIEHDIDANYFSEAGKVMYNFISDYLRDYGEGGLTIPLMMKSFDIPPEDMTTYLAMGNIDFLVKSLSNQHLSDVTASELQSLNADSNLILNNPRKYISNMLQTAEYLNKLGAERKSVDVLETIDEALQLDKNNVIKTGFKELDDKLGGWSRGEDLIALMGRPGQGKSFLGLKFALAASKDHKNDGSLNRVGIYSGEMSTGQIQKRLILLNKEGRMISNSESMNELRECHSFIRLITQKELGGRATVRDLEAMILRDKLDFLFVDQLSLMDDIHPKVYDTKTRFANISADLFSLSTRYSIPIILAVQSNRDGAMQKDAPGLENIAESDAVGQNATRVIGMRRESNVMNMTISKNRYGDDTFIQKYDVQFETGKFIPISTDIANVGTQSNRGLVRNGNSKLGRSF